MKRITGFLFALALAATAMLSAPAKAATTCHPPACLRTPSCCIAKQCGAWCESHGGGTPLCGGNGSGGCCACSI